MRTATLMAIATLAAAGAAQAEVIDAQPGGFELRQSVQVAAPPETVWAALVNVGGWWASSHTYSGDARNLTLEAKPGGCWCETLPGGGVEHLRVVYAQPAQTLRLAGGLGPLQATGGAGHLSFALKPQGGGTALTVTYAFGGYVRGGFQALAGPVDTVLSQQTARLKALAETGKAP
jgi:uncharacterized protein YndB with AHSA1/START domain